jgi:two-component system OmpR family sensor kinase
MRRMWVRLSVLFGVSIMFAIALPFVIAALVHRTGLVDPTPWMIAHSEVTSARRQLAVLGLTASAGLVGILFGTGLSHRLAAPLEELANAARAIGAHDLSRRIRPKGTQEMVEVAIAFNQMAADLEEAERRRRALVADVAHELRTPLTVLQGNLRAILDDVYPLDKEEVTRIYEQTRHLSQLVDDLHELSLAEARQLPLHFRETDVAALIQSEAAVFEPVAAQKQIELHVEVGPSCPRVRADADRLKQVLHNLLSNALRHTPQGGTIALHAGLDEGALRIEVVDTGEGIPAGHLPYVFDRFYRVDRTRARDTGGAGLGLAIVRAIVESHEGRVSAHPNDPGPGTTFAIHLPLSPGEAIADSSGS